MKKLLTCFTLLSALLSPNIFCIKKKNKKGNKGNKGSEISTIETNLSPEDKIFKRIENKIKLIQELWNKNKIEKEVQEFVLTYGFEDYDKNKITQLLIKIEKTATKNNEISITKLIKAIDNHTEKSLFPLLKKLKQIDPKSSEEEFAKYRNKYLEMKIKKTFKGDLIHTSRALDIVLDLIQCFLQNIYERLPK